MNNPFKELLINQALEKRDFDLIKRIQSGEYFEGSENVELVPFKVLEEEKTIISDEDKGGLQEFFSKERYQFKLITSEETVSMLIQIKKSEYTPVIYPNNRGTIGESSKLYKNCLVCKQQRYYKFYKYGDLSKWRKNRICKNCYLEQVASNKLNEV